jgi:hypothetical protein
MYEMFRDTRIVNVLVHVLVVVHVPVLVLYSYSSMRQVETRLTRRSTLDRPAQPSSPLSSSRERTLRT